MTHRQHARRSMSVEKKPDARSDVQGELIERGADRLAVVPAALRLDITVRDSDPPERH
jgi:hypothetical protein